MSSLAEQSKCALREDSAGTDEEGQVVRGQHILLGDVHLGGV